MLHSNWTDELKWTAGARAKLNNIPFFVRSVARVQIEQLARRSSSGLVTVEIVEEARQSFGQ